MARKCSRRPSSNPATIGLDAFTTDILKLSACAGKLDDRVRKRHAGSVDSCGVACVAVADIAVVAVEVVAVGSTSPLCLHQSVSVPEPLDA